MADKRIKTSSLGNLPRAVKDTDIIIIVSRGTTYSVDVKEFLSSVTSAQDDYEGDLGRPTTDGMILASNIHGRRQWIFAGSGDVTLDGAQTLSNKTLDTSNVVMLNTSNFTKHLDPSVTSLQQALDKLDKIMTVNVVNNFTEMVALVAVEGDMCQITSTEEVYVYKDRWIPIQRNPVTVSTVQNIGQRDNLIPNRGDICVVLDEASTFAWDGVIWVTIASTGSGGGSDINDDVTSLGSTWSSTKISTRDIDGGTYI